MKEKVLRPYKYEVVNSGFCQTTLLCYVKLLKSDEPFTIKIPKKRLGTTTFIQPILTGKITKTTPININVMGKNEKKL